MTGIGRDRGLGVAICRQLARSGANIFFTYWQPSLDATYAVNLRATALLSVESIKRYAGDAGGRIINLTENGRVGEETRISALVSMCGMPSSRSIIQFMILRLWLNWRHGGNLRLSLLLEQLTLLGSELRRCRIQILPLLLAERRRIQRGVADPLDQIKNRRIRAITPIVEQIVQRIPLIGIFQQIRAVLGKTRLGSGDRNSQPREQTQCQSFLCHDK